jgi:hypothetical protein
MCMNSQNSKQPKCPSTDEQIFNLVYAYNNILLTNKKNMVLT